MDLKGDREKIGIEPTYRDHDGQVRRPTIAMAFTPSYVEVPSKRAHLCWIEVHSAFAYRPG